MRTLSANALAKIAEKKGSEPITILDIAWNGTDVLQYSDRAVDSIPGKILEVSDLDAVINITGSSNSQSLSVTLDDTDGTIKELMNNYDLHLKDVWVYQYFEELDLSDRFLLFKGKVNSPITWNENDRTVSFSVLSQLEDKEIGFSPEEGQFIDLPEAFVGQPWPMCFGLTIHSKALRVTEVPKAVTATGVGFADTHLGQKASLYGILLSFVTKYFTLDAVELIAGRRGSVSNTYQQQLATETDFIYVYGAENFSGYATLDLGGFKIWGYWNGNGFQITGHEDQCAGKDPPGIGGGYWRTNYNNKSGFLPDGTISGDNCGYKYFGPGTQIKQISPLQPQKYIISIVPGTVEKVTVWGTLYGQRYLQNLSSDLYTIQTESWGQFDVVTLTMHTSPSNTNQNWGDDIYVTFRSSVGPNTVDILKYIINTYTDFTYDSTSFDHVESKVENYPMNFTIYDRPNALTALQEIAWQARCSIYLKNDVFYLQYLPEIQPSVATITEDDILQGTLKLTHTPTEDLVTKMDCKWTQSPMQSADGHVIIRNNNNKYGLHKQDYDYYTFNYIDGVTKSASFWSIRYSNTWKKVSFQTPLHLLNVETLDYVTLDLSNDFVSNSSILCRVDKASYNSDNRSIDFELWCPVRSGEMDAYDFAYPSDISQYTYYPSEIDYDGDDIYSWDKPVEIINENDGNPQPYVTVTGINWPDFDANKNKKTENSEYSKNEKSDIDRRKTSRGNVKPSDIGDISPGEPTLKATVKQGPNSPGPESPDSDNTHILPQSDVQDGDYETDPLDQDEEGGQDDSGTQTDPMDQLPKPEELDSEEHPCMSMVCVTWITIDCTHPSESGLCCSPVQSCYGTPATGDLLQCYEKYVFETEAAARDFADSLNTSLPKSGIPGQTVPYSAGWNPIFNDGGSDDGGCESSTDPIGYDRQDGDKSTTTILEEEAEA